MTNPKLDRVILQILRKRHPTHVWRVERQDAKPKEGKQS